MAGEEILVVDGFAQDREGLRKLLEHDGYIVTATGDARAARELVTNKVFPVMLVDLDVEPGGALDLIRFAREHSNHTGILLLMPRRAYEAAVDAWRAGVLDVLQKRPEEVPLLRRRIAAAIERSGFASDQGAILREVRAVLDESLHRLIDLAQHAYAGAAAQEADDGPPRLLLVDPNYDFVQALATVAGGGLSIAHEVTGGGALDRVGREDFDVVAVREQLPDLPGPMVARSVQEVEREVEALVFSGPGPSGRIDRLDRGRVAEVFRPFATAKDLLDRVQLQAQQLRLMRRQRRILHAFRADNPDYLRRYAELKQRIDGLIG